MTKSLFKCFFVFVLCIFFMFYGLLFFQKHSEKKLRFEAQAKMQLNQNLSIYDLDSMHPKEPPLMFIFLLITLLSGFCFYLFLKYLDNNYVKPLYLIRNKIKLVEKGDFDVKFDTNILNIDIIETYNALNMMIEGLKEKENLQKNFIQNLVHDLRAPIIAQQRALNILEEEFYANELFVGMKENSELYLKMINTIIETFAHKEVVIDKTNFYFSKLVDDVFKMLKSSSDPPF